MKKPKNILNQLYHEKGENPFIVPEAYFEEFSQRLQKRIGSINKEKKAPFSTFLRPQLALAGSISLLLLCVIILFKLIKPDFNDPDLSKNEIASYLEQYTYDIDDTYLLENYTAVVTTAEIIEDGNTTNYKSDIINYLIDENIEINEIYNEL